TRRCPAAADNGVAPTAWVAHFPTMPSMTLSATPTTISRRSSTVARPKTTAMIPKSATLTARYGTGRWIGRGTSRRAPSAEAVKKIARNIRTRDRKEVAAQSRLPLFDCHCTSASVAGASRRAPRVDRSRDGLISRHRGRLLLARPRVSGGPGPPCNRHGLASEDRVRREFWATRSGARGLGASAESLIPRRLSPPDRGH